MNLQIAGGDVVAFIAEIREADADAVTAEIYADIRHSSALPQVNLIYRHLATLPGVLAAVWASICPWVRSADADAVVASLLAARPVVDTTGPLHLVEADKAAILDVLGVYGRGNGLNLLALSGVRLRLSNPHLPTLPAPGSRSTAPPISTIPPLPRLNALPTATANLVVELAGLHDASLYGVTPSLYLHLAHWPGILPSIHGQIESYVRQGGLAADRASVIETAAAYGIVAAPLALAELPAATKYHALAAIDLFTASVIPDLIAVGRMLAITILDTPAAPSARFHRLEP